MFKPFKINSYVNTFHKYYLDEDVRFHSQVVKCISKCLQEKGVTARAKTLPILITLANVIKGTEFSMYLFIENVMKFCRRKTLNASVKTLTSEINTSEKRKKRRNLWIQFPVRAYVSKITLSCINMHNENGSFNELHKLRYPWTGRERNLPRIRQHRDSGEIEKLILHCKKLMSHLEKINSVLANIRFLILNELRDFQFNA